MKLGRQLIRIIPHGSFKMLLACLEALLTNDEFYIRSSWHRVLLLQQDCFSVGSKQTAQSVAFSLLTSMVSISQFCFIHPVPQFNGRKFGGTITSFGHLMPSERSGVAF